MPTVDDYRNKDGQFQKGIKSRIVKDIVYVVAYLGLGNEVNAIRMTKLGYFLVRKTGYSFFNHDDFVSIFHQVDGMTHNNWRIKVVGEWVVVS